jgi:hypothetical protein
MRYEDVIDTEKTFRPTTLDTIGDFPFSRFAQYHPVKQARRTKKMSLHGPELL